MTRTASDMDINACLERRYVAAFEVLDDAFLRTLRSFPARERSSGLEDVFLPTVAQGYADAAVKVMVVGRETRQWRYAAAPAESAAAASPAAGYVSRGMACHRGFLESCLHKPRHKSGLVRLLCQVAKATDAAGLVYSNLFAVAVGGKDPRRHPQAWAAIRDLSQALLNIQIEELQPDVIVFANGSSSAGERRAFFPHEGDAALARCRDHRDWVASAAIPAAHLFGFRMDERIQCYRIQHPSSPAHKTQAKRARQHLLEMLKQHQGAHAGLA
ncbi:hypothetical protein [Variovorax ginsengisoli]|uniref:Uracil-DNA glycosylase-like domain-containing protein n=1 Tax=Variovorax ginsengisoli TaxID=363844 RepID=A0ABT8SEM9_9BURK|nr:hypothetical protein [Variovorax ginsengisoli]MDN8617282.1 hypothetical protein [Variovorax ginsengisoli]MDO1536452.1 hypothetical protein [Variovorax ginsengisoli]